MINLANVPLDPPYACKDCKKDFKSRLGLARHIKSHKPKTPAHIQAQLDKFWNTIRMYRTADEGRKKLEEQENKPITDEQKLEAVNTFLEAIAPYSDGKIDVDTHLPK